MTLYFYFDVVEILLCKEEEFEINNIYSFFNYMSKDNLFIFISFSKLSVIIGLCNVEYRVSIWFF